MSDEQSSSLILGVPPHRFARPLWEPLRQHTGYSLQEDSPTKLAIQLRNHEIHSALLTPIDYARDYAIYRIAPRAGIASRGESRAITLSFTKGLRSIRTIAVEATSTSEIVLCQLVLAEKYDIHPTFLPLNAHLVKPYSQSDATLFSGDVQLSPTESLDLVDEWTDMTNLPYIHTMWVSRDTDLSPTDIERLIEAAVQAEQKKNGTTPFIYVLNEKALDGLSEFLRMAYYHGILQDIADVKFHSFDETSLPQSGTSLS